MTEAELKNTTLELLNTFHARRLDTLRTLTLSALVTSGHVPFYAVENTPAYRLVEASVHNFLADSEKSLFETCFYHPLMAAIYEYRSVAPSCQFTNSAKRQVDGESIYWYRAAVGYSMSYASGQYAVEELGQELTGSANLQIKLLALLQAVALPHASQYNQELNRLVNRLNSIFLLNFTTGQGNLNWNKLLAYSSGKNTRIKLRQAVEEPGTGKIVVVEVADSLS